MAQHDRLDSVVCSVATNRDELKAAFQLVYNQYLKTGLVQPSHVGMRITDYQLTEQCEIVVAKVNEQVVGTISIIVDKLRLPLEPAFPNVISELRKQKLKLAEIGCLAAIQDSESSFSPTFAALTRAAIYRSRALGCDRMVAAVHPRHCRFYKRAMGFEQLSNAIPYESVEGQLAVCLAGDPSNPMKYQSPWREIFFDSSTAVTPFVGQGISQADRSYFLNKKLATTKLPDSRAA